jgi:thioredoxin reductase (NADPH)
MAVMRPLKNLAEIAVVGGGLAGLAAARHALRLGRLVTLFEGSGLYGGQLATVGEVEDLPFAGTFSGQDLAIHLLQAVRKLGAQVIESGIAQLEPGTRLTLTDETGKTCSPAAVVIASGVAARKLGVPGEDELLGRGVSRCATCDGGFFRNQDVVVIGGGDGAVHEALVLAKTSRRVTVVSRSPMRAKREHIDRLAARENLSFTWNHAVTAILGADGVTGIRLRDINNGKISELECAGVFPFIGGVPNSSFVPASLLLPGGHISTGADLATADRRVFAAGAVRAGYGGNALQAMAEGLTAAESAARLLAR